MVQSHFPGGLEGQILGCLSEPPEGQEGLGQSFLSDWHLRAAAETAEWPMVQSLLSFCSWAQPGA